MIALIIPNIELSKFPIWNTTKDSQWIPLNNTVNSKYWLQLEAEQDLIDNGIEYTIGQVEIKQDNLE
jgi:hypothetical protein